MALTSRDSQWAARTSFADEQQYYGYVFRSASVPVAGRIFLPHGISLIGIEKPSRSSINWCMLLRTSEPCRGSVPMRRVFR